MPDPKRQDEFERRIDESEEAFDARLERLEKELGARIDREAAEDPLLASPPKAFPIPDVLKERPDAGRAARRGGAGEDASRSALARIYAIGTDFGVTVIAGIAIGWTVDHFARTGPWGLLVGLALGFVVGGVRFFREGLAANRRALEELRKRRG
jgi:ATP synthase protein I